MCFYFVTGRNKILLTIYLSWQSGEVFRQQAILLHSQRRGCLLRREPIWKPTAQRSSLFCVCSIHPFKLSTWKPGRNCNRSCLRITLKSVILTTNIGFTIVIWIVIFYPDLQVGLSHICFALCKANYTFTKCISDWTVSSVKLAPHLTSFEFVNLIFTNRLLVVWWCLVVTFRLVEINKNVKIFFTRVWS